MGVLLTVDQLKTYFYTRNGTVKAVDGVSFTLDHGETLGIVGESGSGKTVTGLSLTRLIPNPPGKVVGGQITFAGQDLLGLSDDEMRKVRGKAISMVFQEPMTSLNPVLTIGKQIGESLRLHMGMTGKEAQDRTVELLQMVRIPDAKQRLSQYPHQMSGGMRQRVMIAIALSCNPQIIIADEATTALDVTVQAQIMLLFDELVKRLGSALIVITHNLGLVARHVDKVMVLYAGQVMESAATEELFRNPCHPYTRALQKSIPRLDQSRVERLIPIKGEPPNLANPPPGCPFSPRCTYAQERCDSKPALRQVAAGHYSACWFDLDTLAEGAENEQP